MYHIVRIDYVHVPALKSPGVVKSVSFDRIVFAYREIPDASFVSTGRNVLKGGLFSYETNAQTFSTDFVFNFLIEVDSTDGRNYCSLSVPVKSR